MAIEAQTKIKLISDALVLIGEKPASSLTEDRYGVTVGVNIFETLYENELQSNRWRFSIKKGALSLLVAEPLNEWKRAFQLPADMLLPLGTYPASNYEIYGDHLYTNETEVELEYVFKPEISEVPAYFALLMKYALARVLIKPVTEPTSGVTIEHFTQLYNIQRNTAMYADAQGRPNRRMSHSPFTMVR